MVEFLGANDAVGKGASPSPLTKWAIIGGVLVGLFLLLRRKGVPPSGPSPSPAAARSEFIDNVSQARGDIGDVIGAQIAFREMEARSRNTPGGLTVTYTGDEWASLPKAARRAFARQAKGGRLLVIPKGDGSFQVTPTERGIRGDEPKKREKPRPWYETAIEAAGDAYTTYTAGQSARRPR